MQPSDQAAPARSPTRERLARVGLVVLGMLLALLLLEAMLQAAAAYVHTTGRHPSLLRIGRGRRVLSLGDSNTFGLYLDDPSRAYPALAGELWNRRHPDDPIEILNMGYPGNNSSQLLLHLPEMLEAAQPQLVTVMIGVNDFWTVPAATDGTPPTTGSVLWRHSRLYRLLYMLTRAREAERVEVIAEQAGTDGVASRVVRYRGMEVREVTRQTATPHEKWRESLRRNLVAIVQRARAAGAEVLLLTYPSPYDWYARADATIREAARETAAPLVDLALVFQARCPRPRCPELFFRDQHPTAKGHAIAAELLADALPPPRP